MRKELSLLLLPTISGLLLFCAFPRLSWRWLGWAALVPLLVAVLRVVNPRRAFLAGWVAGAVEAALLLSWIPRVLRHYGGVATPLSLVLFALMTAVLAVYPAAACAGTRVLAVRFGPRLLFAFPALWVAQEYLLSLFPFGGFPWLNLAYSQTDCRPLIQIADVTGVYGVSFVVTLVNASLAWIWHARSRWVERCLPLGLAALLLLGCVCYGRFASARWAAPGDHTVAMLQADISMDESDAARSWKFLHGYAELAGQLPPGTTDLLLIPESPSPLSFQYDAAYRETMIGLARRYPLGLVLNNIAFEGSGSESRYYNSAYFLAPDGSEKGRYDKIRLVPFGEYVPLSWLFRFVQSISREVGGFSAGHAVVTVSLAPSRSAGALICFEAVFPQLCRQNAAQGAGVLINLTNDEWYGDSAAPHQHLAIARWRAVENRRFFLRATNSGISAVIDPRGDVHGATRLLAQDICRGTFSFERESTFYTRHGDLLAHGCVIISISLLFCAAIGRPRRAARP